MKHCVPIVLLAIFTSGCTSAVRHDLNYSKPSALGHNLTYIYECKIDTPGSVTPVTRALVSSNCGDRYFKNAYEDASDDTERKIVRDRIIYELLTVIDDDYAVYEIEVRLNRSTKDTIVAIVSIGLTGAASLASKGAANTLAASDTGLKGANAAVDTNFMKDKTTEILLNAMRGNRAIELKKIYDSMSNEIKDYPLEAALRDLVAYYNEGSLTSALNALAAQTASNAKEKQKDAQDASPSQ
jgi:hypothetical protein